MKRILALIFLMMLYWEYAQNESPIFSINDGMLNSNRRYIETNDSANIGYTLRSVGQVEVGNVVYTIRTAKFSGWDDEPGFNVVEISNGNQTVFQHKQIDALIAFDEDLYGQTLRRFSDNDQFITGRLSDETAIVLFVGWTYANTPSQLLIIALTPEDVKTVYNKPANIISMTNEDYAFSMTIQTSVPESDRRVPTHVIENRNGTLWIKPY